jgi:hypothetical protein
VEDEAKFVEDRVEEGKAEESNDVGVVKKAPRRRPGRIERAKWKSRRLGPPRAKIVEDDEMLPEGWVGDLQEQVVSKTDDDTLPDGWRVIGEQTSYENT